MTASRTPIADQVRALHPSSDEDAAPTPTPAPAGTSPTGVLPVGSLFPSSPLFTVTGGNTTVHEVRAGRPAVVVFYRGSWCPYCNLTLRTYRERLAYALWEKDIAFLAISPQSPDESLSLAEKLDLEFDVLSDPGSDLGHALRITHTPDDGYVTALTSHGIDLEEINADGSTRLPHPTVAILDTDGRLAWIDVHTDYTTRTEPDDILDAITRLFPQAASRTNT
jgi:peroxiredoxin